MTAERTHNGAGTLTPEDVAREVRRRWDAFDTRDIDAIVRHGQDGVGFGWRTAAARSTQWASVSAGNVEEQGDEAFRAPTTAWFAKMERYRCKIDELHTKVDGSMGFAWGVAIEEFTVRGRAPERARVRFTVVLKKVADGWRSLLYHRDIQLFDLQGRYLTEHTRTG